MPRDRVREAGDESRIAVVVVGYDSRQWLVSCFSAIMADIPESALVYFVDNRSGDGSGELVRARFPRVVVISEAGNRGFSGGCNDALLMAFAAGARFAVLLNPDTRCRKGFIGGATAFLKENPDFAAVGPMQIRYDQDEPKPNRWSARVLLAGHHDVLHDWLPAGRRPPAVPWDGSPLVECRYVQGAAMAISADAVSAVGGFEELFEVFFEEADFCRKARAAGFRIGMLTGLYVEHRGRGVRDGNRNRMYHRLKSRYIYAMTDHEISPADRRRLLRRWAWLDFRGCLVGRNLDGPLRPGVVVRAFAAVLAELPRIRRLRLSRALAAGNA